MDEASAYLKREFPPDRADVERRNKASMDGLDAYYSNFVHSDEIPCQWNECGGWKNCNSDCEWYDFEYMGLWYLSSSDRLEELYNKAKPEGCPANPFRYSHVIGEWIVPGALCPWVSGTSLSDMMDEYEPLAALSYAYRFVGGSTHDHAHSLNGVVLDMLRDPARFYIPIWASEGYSKQELLLLEVVRERLCHDMSVLPEVEIIWADEEDEKRRKDMEKDGGAVFPMRVRARIAELREYNEAYTEGGKQDE